MWWCNWAVLFSISSGSDNIKIVVVTRHNNTRLYFEPCDASVVSLKAATPQHQQNYQDPELSVLHIVTVVSGPISGWSMWVEPTNTWWPSTVWNILAEWQWQLGECFSASEWLMLVTLWRVWHSRCPAWMLTSRMLTQSSLDPSSWSSPFSLPSAMPWLW